MKVVKLLNVRYSVLFLLIFIPVFLFSQSNNRRIIPFNVYGEDLKYPLTGGLNSPQFSYADLNNDGIEDLYIFDRVGSVQLTFLNQGNPNASSYEFAPEYVKNFPSELQNFVKLKDYDDDGIMDIFGYSVRPGVDGVCVYKGSYEDDELVFDLIKDVIFYPTLSNGLPTNLFVSTIDLPEIVDIDCDGDLDILTFGTGGGYLYFYKNQSIEKGFERDSLIFTLEDNCLGGFYETGMTADIILAAKPGDCANMLDDDDEAKGSERHAGSTILCFDENNDGQKEIFLGDLSYSFISRLSNDGDCSEAYINGVDSSYPSYDVPAEVGIFSAAFYLDVDNDGNNDLLISPNSKNGSEDDDVVWFYKNVTNNEFPSFQFQTKDFLVHDMVDFGSGTNPTFVDYNSDGLLDLVVGTRGYLLPFGDLDPRLFLFENVGTATSPAYELIDDDWLNTADFFGGSTVNWSVAFGDLDNDGDEDLVMGEEQGLLIYAENIAGANNTMEFGQFVAGYMDIDPGQHAKPFIYDLNEDGLNDLVVGEKNGKINYFQNVGTANEADFISDPTTFPNTDFLGKVNVQSPGFIDGFSAPVLKEVNGELLLFVGSRNGDIKVYDNILGNLYGEFNKLYEKYGQIKEGENTHITIGDVDNDEYFELLVGNKRGGLAAYNTIFDAPPTTVNSDKVITNSVKFNVFPNPVEDILNIELEKFTNKSINICVYNTLQQKVLTREFNNSQIAISIDDLSSGIYFIEIQLENTFGIQKIVVK